MVNISFRGFQHHPRVVVWDFVHQQHGSGNTGPLNKTPSKKKETFRHKSLIRSSKNARWDPIPPGFVVKKIPRCFFLGKLEKQRRRVGNSPLNGGENM